MGTVGAVSSARRDTLPYYLLKGAANSCSYIMHSLLIFKAELIHLQPDWENYFFGGRLKLESKNVLPLCFTPGLYHISLRSRFGDQVPSSEK